MTRWILRLTPITYAAALLWLNSEFVTNELARNFSGVMTGLGLLCIYFRKPLRTLSSSFVGTFPVGDGLPARLTPNDAPSGTFVFLGVVFFLFANLPHD